MATDLARGWGSGAGRLVRVAPGYPELAAAAGFADPAALSDPAAGIEVVTHRSSWVRELRLGPERCFAKTYDYPRWQDRARGWLRTTCLAPSRADREAAAADWLRANGFAAAEPLLVWELRHRGQLWRALLITRAVPGRPLDRLLPELPAAERAALLQQLDRWLARLHAAGFRDRNLDLRNLLAEPAGDPADPESWRIAKIDSPRWRLRAPMRDDRLARADRARLARSIAAVLPPPARA
jgi:hypothetical protein